MSRAPLVLALFLVAFPQPATAIIVEPYTTVPVLINVLPGVTVTDAELAGIINEANKVLSQAKIHLAFDVKKDVKRDFNDRGNNDDKIATSENAKLNTDSLTELNNHFGKGSGYKVVFSNGINESNSAGLAMHNYTYPVTYISVNTNPKVKGLPARGNDLAHEFCHTFTLGGHHHISPGVQADDTWHHPTDTGNLMYPWNNGDTIKRGGNLTPTQIAEIKENVPKRGQTKTTTTSPFIPIIGLVTTSQTTESDDVGDVPEPHSDIAGISFFIDDGGTDMELGLTLGGAFPTGVPLDAEYRLYFDTDNNPGTGGVFGAYSGIDRVVQIDLVGFSPFSLPGEFEASVIDGMTLVSTPISAGQIEPIGTLLDVVEGPATPTATDLTERIDLAIPLAELGALADDIPITVVSEDQMSFLGEEVPIVFTLPRPAAPTFNLIDLRGVPGDDIQYEGSGFLPLDDVDFFLDGNPLGLGVAALPNGLIGGVFAIPQGLSPGAYFLIARDSVGYDFSILTVDAPVPALPPFAYAALIAMLFATSVAMLRMRARLAAPAKL